MPTCWASSASGETYGIGHGAHVHGAGADTVDERRSPVDVLVQHQAAQRLGVADEHRPGDAPRPGRSHVGRRGVDERDEQLGAADDLGQRVGVVHERRRRHGVDAEALLLAAERRHLLHAREHGAVARGDEQRLARAAQHRDDLHQVVDLPRSVLGQTHAHDEVDVGQLLAERRHALDVGAADPATLAALRVAHVQHVRAGAVVDLSVTEDERRGVAAARLERPLARRARERVLDEARRDADAATVHRSAGGPEELQPRLVAHVHARVGQQLQRGLVQAPALGLAPDGESRLRHIGPPKRGAGRTARSAVHPARIP